MDKTSILIIDDEKNLTRSLTFALSQSNMHCEVAHDGDTGIQLAMLERPDAILLDVRLENESGLDILPQLKSMLPDTPVIMMSAYGDTKDVVQAIKEGAVDYLTKPFDIDELLLLVDANIARKKLTDEVQYLRDKAAFSEGIIGDSPAVRQLSENIECVVASTLKTVLLLGDTGVGKTMVAKEIHAKSFDKSAPFVEINCASLPSELIEAELFGAEKGSYTGATSKRVGLIEVANQGTLFLDEIGELPLHLQAKLLTFLESWIYRPIGASREKTADVLVIMATNRDLNALVQENRFRNDLYFRINTMPITIPALRDRGDDLSILLNYFIDFYSNREASRPIELKGDTLDLLKQYQWPGNIRELKNLVERLTILYSGKTILPEYLPPEILNSPVHKKSVTIEDSLLNNERELILQALNECQWRKGLTAEKLGISRHALKRRIQKLGLE
jgi:DNA-binding NtrC family response regulator